jgi:hypothetical protein
MSALSQWEPTFFNLPSADTHALRTEICRPILQDLSDNLRRLLVSAEQLLALLTLALDRVILVEQLLEQLLLVQFADKAVLHNVFAVIDEQVHDGFGHLIGGGLADNGEVGADEAADKLGLKGFALGESGVGVVVGLDRFVSLM